MDAGEVLHKPRRESATPREFTLYVCRGSRSELFYGFEMLHSNDPSHPAFYKLGEALEAFQDEAFQFELDPETRCIFIMEGEEPPLMESDLSYNDYIRLGSERQVFAEWCDDRGYKIVSPDTGLTEAHELADIFAAEDVVDYYVFRYIPQMMRMGLTSEEDVRTYLEDRIVYLCHSFGSSGSLGAFETVDFSFENMARRYEQRYGLPLGPLTDEHNQLAHSETHEYFQPETEADSVVKKISRTINALRNEELFSMIDHYWRQGYKIFCLFGKPHLSDIEGQLELLGTLTSDYFDRPAVPPCTDPDVAAARFAMITRQMAEYNYSR